MLINSTTARPTSLWALTVGSEVQPRPSRLSPHSWTESSPRPVYLIHCLATLHTSGPALHAFQARKGSEVAAVSTGLSQASIHALLASRIQAPPAPLCPVDFSVWKGAPQGEGLPLWTFPPSKISPRGTGPHPDAFFFPSYLVMYRSFPQLWLYKRSPVSFHLVFCENCPTCRCIFDVFAGEVSSTSSYSAILMHLCKMSHVGCFWSWGWG